MKENENMLPPENDNNTSASDSAQQGVIEKKQPENIQNKGTNAEGAAYQTSISSSAEGEAMISEGRAGGQDGGEPGDGKGDGENAAEELAENLTPGEQILIRAAEENAKDIKEEEKRKEGAKPKSELAYYLRVGGTLTVICACIALLLAIVNAITADKIAENRRREMDAAISAIFSDFDSTEEIEGVFADPVTSITAVKRGDTTIGYCVFASPKGFKSSISLAVGVSAGHRVKGVKVLSVGDTPGVGTRVDSESFLWQFVGKTKEMTFGESVNALAGATISSKAVFSGVKAALEEIAKISDPVEIDEEASATKETDGEAHASPETDGESTATPETDGEAHATTETDGEAHASPEGEAQTGGEAPAETDGEAHASPETDGEAHATVETEAPAAQTDAEASASVEADAEASATGNDTNTDAEAAATAHADAEASATHNS